MRRMPFFSPPLEANDAGLRVTEDAPYRWTWPEIGNAIGVPEAWVWSHPAIMPDVQTPAHTEFTPLFPRRCRCSRFVYPLTKEKSPYFDSGDINSVREMGIFCAEIPSKV